MDTPPPSGNPGPETEGRGPTCSEVRQVRAGRRRGSLASPTSLSLARIPHEGVTGFGVNTHRSKKPRISAAF
jgi:hypothetical protein